MIDTGPLIVRISICSNRSAATRVVMLQVLARIFERHGGNSTVTGSEPPAAMWCNRLGSSKVAKFAADFFAAEVRAWRGGEPLWKVFWVYGVATSVAIVVLYVVNS